MAHDCRKHHLLSFFIHHNYGGCNLAKRRLLLVLECNLEHLIIGWRLLSICSRFSSGHRGHFHFGWKSSMVFCIHLLLNPHALRLCGSIPNRYWRLPLADHLSRYCIGLIFNGRVGVSSFAASHIRNFAAFRDIFGEGQCNQ